MNSQFLKRAGQPDLAYVFTPGQAGVPVMFCGGYRSDMGGTKAMFLEEQCRARGQGYLRFDYSGHGESGGRFEDGLIGSWAQDAADMMAHVYGSRKVVVVGSSMGGWVSLLLAKRRPQNLHAMIGIAAAPDFTDIMLARLSPEQQAALAAVGSLEVGSDYSDIKYYLTTRFFEEAREHMIFTSSHRFDFPIRLLQGKSDMDVPWETAEAIKSHFADSDIEITYVEDGDHRLSRPEDLALLDACVRALSGF
jgi:pimeloyl-ACP methyl ester carboxylesterase